MKSIINTAIVMSIFFVSIVLAGKLILVEENHAEIESAGITYILDSYIVMFEQPYYISIQRKDNQPIDAAIAEKIAVEYILPRGCTEPLKRRADLDKANEDSTKLVIGVAC